MGILSKAAFGERRPALGILPFPSPWQARPRLPVGVSVTSASIQNIDMAQQEQQGGSRVLLLTCRKVPSKWTPKARTSRGRPRAGTLAESQIVAFKPSPSPQRQSLAVAWCSSGVIARNLGECWPNCGDRRAARRRGSGVGDGRPARRCGCRN